MSEELDEARRVLEEQRKEVMDILTSELTTFGYDYLYKLNVSKEHYQMLRTIAKSEAEYLARQAQGADDGLSKVLMELSLSVAATVIAQVEPLIGVQPMPSPVSKVDNLCLRDGELMLESFPVEAATLRLQAALAVKDAKELISLFRGEHATSQLRITTEEIASELVREILSDLLGISHHDNTDLTGIEMTPGRLRSEMLELADTVGNLTKRVGNFAVGDRHMLALLTELEDFDAVSEDEVKSRDEVHFVGTLAKTIRVYCTKYDNVHYLDHYNPAVVVGYRGFSETDLNQHDAAYIFCPYVPVLCAGVIMNPVTHQPVTCFMTRRGKFVIREADQVKYKETFRNHYKSLSFKI